MMGGGGILGGGMDSGMAAPQMVHQKHQGTIRTVPDDYDDPNDPFPALTRSHAGGRMSANDQTVTVNIGGLGGRGTVQRTALGGVDDGFANIGMPAANANRPGGRRARAPNETPFMTPEIVHAPLFTPNSMSSMGNLTLPNTMPNTMQMPLQPTHQQIQQQQQQVPNVCMYTRALALAIPHSITCRPHRFYLVRAARLPAPAAFRVYH